MPSILYQQLKCPILILQQDTSSNNGNKDKKNLLRLPLTDDKLSQLQSQDMFCSHIITQLKKGKH